MQLVHYAGLSLVTGDAITLALLRYAGALAVAEEAATVQIPVRTPDGGQSSATLLVGPASQLAAEPIESEHDELLDAELVAHFEALASSVSTTARPITADGPVTGSIEEDL